MTTLARFNRPLLLILALAFSVRLVALVILAPTLDFQREGNAIHGSEAYDAYAVNWLATGIYGRVAGVPDAAIPPLYSYALALVYALFGRGFVQIGIFHTLIDLCAIALVWDIGRRLFARVDKPLWGRSFAEWVGIISALAFSFYPYLIFQNLTLIDTPFWILLLHLFVWLVLLLRERPALDRTAWALALAAGLILGAATLTRPITPLLAALVGVWYLMRLSLWQSVVRLLPVALVSVACVGLWVARNYALYEGIVLTTNGGSNFWTGSNKWVIPVFRAGYDVQWVAPEPDEIPVYPPEQPHKTDSALLRLGLSYLDQNRQQVLELLWVKFLVHWSIELAPRLNPQAGEQWSLSADGQQLIIRQAETSIAGVTSANTSYNSGLMDTLGRPVHLVYYGGLFLLSCVGFVLSWRWWRDASLLWMVQFSMTFMYVLFHPATRYRAPSDPLLFVLSALALVLLVQAWQARRPSVV